MSAACAARTPLVEASPGSDLVIAIVTDGTSDGQYDGGDGDGKATVLPSSVAQLAVWRGGDRTACSSTDNSHMDTLSGWLGQACGSPVLVRPDGVVAWVAPAARHLADGKRLTAAHCESQLRRAFDQALCVGK